MELQAVEKSYARWAPVYDRTFGAVTNVGRRRATALLSGLGGSVLEVGVGTGLALRHYDRRVSVTGIDYSAEMLDKARAKVNAEGLRHVAALHRMDARMLAFPDGSFDHVAQPGGSVVIVNHFARKTGPLALAERVAAPLADLLGWHSDFDRARVLGEARLTLAEECTLPPLGMMTLLRLVKTR